MVQKEISSFLQVLQKLAEAVPTKIKIFLLMLGQIMFGQTITASGDNQRQYANHGFSHANPNKWVCMDIECDAGCGLVPFQI